MLQIGVQGPLQVEVDGALADLGGPRQRAVLLRLLVGQGSSVSVDRLLTDLYEGAPPPSALSGLQAYLSHVRRTLERHRAQRAAPTVLLTAPPGSAAAAGRRPGRGRLRSRPAQAAEQLAGADPSRAVAHLDAALARWRGEAYAEVAFEPWVVPEAVRLTEQRSREVLTDELGLNADSGMVVHSFESLRPHVYAARVLAKAG